MGAEMGTEEERAWRNIWNGVRELEEEDGGRDGNRGRESMEEHLEWG
jgi:hypothetical protein